MLDREIVKPKPELKVITQEARLVEAGPTISYAVKAKISEGSNPILSYGVCWSKVNNATIHDRTLENSRNPVVTELPNLSNIIDSVFTGTIFGETLEPKTTYYVRAYALDKDSIVYGNELNFATPCFLSHGSTVIDRLKPLDHSENQPLDIHLEWMLEINSPGLKCNVYLDNDPDPDCLIAEDLTGGWLEIKDLKKSTTYYWKVFAHNDSVPCQNITSAIYSFRTIDSVGLPTIITKSVKSTSRYAILEAEIVWNGGMQIQQKGFFWGDQPKPEDTGNKISLINIGCDCLSSSTKTGFYVILTKQIRPSATYFVKAFASNNLGYNVGEEMKFSTELPANDFITDIEGNIYKISRIGSQVWMTESLNSKKFNDGSEISGLWSVQNNDTYPQQCAFENNNEKAIVYGRLYNWSAVNSGKLCPSGWHVPSSNEWITLKNYLINNQYYYDGSLTGDKSGFSALPTGSRQIDILCPDFGACVRFFRDIGAVTWWSATETNIYYALSYSLTTGPSSFSETTSNKLDGYAVRCIKDQ